MELHFVSWYSFINKGLSKTWTACKKMQKYSCKVKITFYSHSISRQSQEGEHEWYKNLSTVNWSLWLRTSVLSEMRSQSIKFHSCYRSLLGNHKTYNCWPFPFLFTGIENLSTCSWILLRNTKDLGILRSQMRECSLEGVQYWSTKSVEIKVEQT